MDQYAVPVVWSRATRAHDPWQEIWVGVPTPGTEVSDRVEVILRELIDADHALVEADPQPDDVLRQVHDADFLRFLETASERWLAGPYVEEVGQERVVPYLFPTQAMSGGLPLKRPVAVHAEAGRYAYDTMTLVSAGTWWAARSAVDCALVAAGLVLDGSPIAYALTRPPGHHATRAGYGGSCYLNNAAVAAQALRSGYDRIAVVDLDAHHGNGTAAIFYDRADVYYGSVHVDPGAGWFPHYVGFADETGSGEGKGCTRNLTMPEGAGDEPWLVAVAELADWVSDCDALVVSLGVDAAGDDPESPLRVTHDGYRAAGELMRGTGLPSVVVQEGGYHLSTLGTLVAAYLEGHARGSLPSDELR